MLHHYQSYRNLNSFHCASVYVIVYQMWCRQRLLSWTHTLLKCKLGSLSVLMPLNSVFLACMRSYRTCRACYGVDLCTCIADLCGRHLFCLWAALFWTTKMNLSKTQSESAERNLLSTLIIFHRIIGVNVTDLCRKSLAEHNRYGDWQLFDELKLKCFMN